MVYLPTHGTFDVRIYLVLIPNSALYEAYTEYMLQINIYAKEVGQIITNKWQ